MLVEPVSSWIRSTAVPCLHRVCIAMCTSCIYNEFPSSGPLNMCNKSVFAPEKCEVKSS